MTVEDRFVDGCANGRSSALISTIHALILFISSVVRWHDVDR